MRAVIVTQPGAPEVLKVIERPKPHPGPGEVLIKVLAAGVNRPDVAQRKGNYPPPPGTSPDIPGLEVAGIIEGLGPNCLRWKIGDKVCALLAGGGYATYAAAPEGQCLRVPEGFSFVEAASLPETFFTVWSNVFDRGKLRYGEKLLIHGGSSGIGVTAIQMAKVWGCTVFVTVGSDDKCSFCESLGADKAINYKSQKFKEEIHKLTLGLGVDVILDMIGGDYFADNVDILAEDGRLVLINIMKGDETTIKLSKVMRKRLTITGSTLRARNARFKSSITKKLEEIVWPWLESKKVKPIIFRTFPLERAAEAHQLMESSTHIGKIVFDMEER
jgi:NADPH:quinone reductase